MYMVNKPMTRCSTYMSSQKCKLKQQRYHYTLIRIAKIWNTDNTKCWRGCRATEILSLPVGRQNGTATLEDSLANSYKTKQTLIIRSSNRAPWQLPKGVENYVHLKICTQLCTVALFTITNTWKQPRCPSVGKWINKL